jgi:hypothetical protein
MIKEQKSDLQQTITNKNIEEQIYSVSTNTRKSLNQSKWKKNS